MKTSPSPGRFPRRGFALVVTLTLMILLTVIAVGLLTLSSISLRSSSGQTAVNTARANARLGLMLALGELQKNAGDDRRITADSSILDGVTNENVVGVWKSWSPKLADNPLAAAPVYATAKDSRFVTWLTSSSNPTDLQSKDWAKGGPLANPIELFTKLGDGFVLSGSKVAVMQGQPSAGTMAWAVVQDATRAKINIAGPESNQRVRNEDLQVQARPSLAKSATFNQPTADWNERANRVVSMAQAHLDTDLWKGGVSSPERGDFTAQGLGLLTDVVNGGLKVDMSLGFEMSDSDFKADTWGAFKNPFRGVSAPQMGSFVAYKGQRPLFRPLTSSGSVRVDLTFNPASTYFEFPAAAVPTFDTLRSFYRTPHHLYTTPDGPTVFERGMDHVALKVARTGNGFPSPGTSPPALTTQTSYRPVLDRVIYLLSVGLGPDKEVRLVMTPLVTLWNPYNVALEIEGAVVYPWMDVPFGANWTFRKNGVAEPERGVGLSQVMGVQFRSQDHGRSVNPYFFASITPDGSGTAATGKSIRFKPGEVRVFVPTNQTEVEYVSNASIRNRMLPLRPVENASQFSLRGGFAIPMRNAQGGGGGFARPMTAVDSVSVNFVPSTGSDYPFSIGLEDATRAKLSNPNDTNRGESVGDVQTVNFARSGATASMQSPVFPYNELLNPALRKPFGVIETYHRVASDASINRRSDLVFTTNPRQAYINRYLTTGTFLAGPHYETRMRAISSTNGLMDTANGGRSAFYGNSNGATGESQLAFFEAPQAPLLSLAAFQHADLAGTAYSPANQFGNSWASAYLGKNFTAERTAGGNGGTGDATYNRGEMPVYDYSYLANESLWDSFFFSGAAPTLQPGSSGGSPAVWANDIARVTRSHTACLTDFITDPLRQPLQNSRMRFHLGNSVTADLKTDLVKPEGCLKFAANLYVDGAFNINSTSEKAWIAFLSGMRDANFTVRDGNAPGSGKTAFPRFRNPIGDDSNQWMGFRSLDDSQVEELARNIILEVKKRGPFLSLGEFVNRRVDGSALALKGAVQSAIDVTTFNRSSLYDSFDTSAYPVRGKTNITPANAGVGIPGFLTQADVLQSIAPVMAARSDTFTIRSYGEAKDKAGKVIATAWCEAVVQRTPEFVDEANPAHTAIADLKPVNVTFGRRFAITSFRYLSNKELAL